MIKEESRFADSTVFEGMTSIRALLDNLKEGKENARKIEKILFDKEKEKSKARELGYLKKMSELFGFELLGVTSNVIDSYTVGASHGGIIALCSEKTYPKLTKENLVENGFYVMIEGIEDPYNFGYSVRSIYASGADGIIIPPRNWMGVSGVVARSSAGTSELIDMRVANATEAIDIFKDCGYTVICAGIRDSESIFEAELKKPLLVILGGEKRGISREVLNKADKIVRIDYGRSFNGSLSTAASVAVFAFEISRVNR